MKIYIIATTFLALLIRCNATAQVTADTDVEPKPYLLHPYFDQIVKGQVKQVAVITKLDKDRGKKDDTSMIYYYNTEKKRSTEIRYENNQASLVYHYRYDGANLVEWLQDENAAAKRMKFIVRNEFDKQGNKRTSKGYYISKQDTVNRSFQFYDYNASGNITKRVTKTNDVIEFIDNYHYNNNLLIKHDFFTDHANLKNYMSTVYSYTADNLLAEKKQFQIRDTAKTLFSWHRYEYQDSQLVKEKYNNPSSPAIETSVSYTYENNRLKEMYISKDSLYKNVLYEYDNKNVKRITVKTNAWNGLHGEFYIPLSSLISPLTKMPILYEEQYRYDEKENLAEKKFLLNGEIVKLIEFKIDYY